jgi:DNA-directed RNA polymerase sigma subunit (sigma70/sigma32)
MLAAELYRRASAGDEDAVYLVFKHNEGLVGKAIKDTCRHLHGDELDDAYQEARLALLKAVRCYNVDSGHKFSTYALVSIKRIILRELPKSVSPTPVRVPTYLMDAVRRYYMIWQEYLRKYGKSPTAEYMRDAIGKIHGTPCPPSFSKIREIHDLMVAMQEETSNIEGQPLEFSCSESGYERVDSTDRCKAISEAVRRHLVKCTEDCTVCARARKCPYTVFRLKYMQDDFYYEGKKWKGTVPQIAGFLHAEEEFVKSSLRDIRRAFRRVREEV